MGLRADSYRQSNEIVTKRIHLGGVQSGMREAANDRLGKRPFVSSTRSLDFILTARGSCKSLRGVGWRVEKGPEVMNILIRFLFLLGGWCRVYIPVL